MPSTQYVLVTGGNGFLGSEVLCQLKEQTSYVARSIVRERHFADENVVSVGNIDAYTIWGRALEQISTVIHCAARVHIMNGAVSDSLAEFRRVNVDGTMNLARQAAASGVKRFIFLSSIKVNGESTTRSKPFTEQDVLAPQDFYGLSKLEAEDGLRLVSTETGMEVVIIRPPLVYGPGVKANFRSLLKLASTGFPLPFGAIHNRRSMVYVENIADFIIKCIDHPAAANQTFLVSDGEDLSLASVLRQMRMAFGRSPRLFPVPVSLFRLAGSVTGKRAVVDRLVGDLQIDSSKARSLLDWQPPFTVEEGIHKTVEAYEGGEAKRDTVF